MMVDMKLSEWAWANGVIRESTTPGSTLECCPSGLTELVGTQPAQNVAVTRENRRDRMPGSCYYTTL